VDPHFLRRALLALMVTLLTCFATYVSSSTYSVVGRDPNAWQSKMGVFDWMIGHDCQDWSFWRRWSREYIGMNLVGLIETAPAGLWLFYFGYGWDFLFSGASIGIIYEIAWDISSTKAGLETGSPLGELLFGSWLWFSLIASILTYRNNPVNTPNSKDRKWRIAFYITLGIIEVIFVGSCIAYSFVEQSDMQSRDQSLMGLMVATLALVLTQLVYMVTSPILKGRTSAMEFLHYFDERAASIESLVNPELQGYVPVPPEEESKPLNIQRSDAMRRAAVCAQVHEVAFPQGKKPYCYLLMLVRWVSIVNLVALILLMFYVVIADGIMHPCEIPYKS